MAKRRGLKKTGASADQLVIEGTEQVKNDRLHRMARRYARLRDARIDAGRAEKESHDTLLMAMKEEGVEVYEYGNLCVAITASHKVKVSTDGSGSEADQEADAAAAMGVE